MEDSQQEELEELLTRRIISQVEAEEIGAEKVVIDDTPITDRGVSVTDSEVQKNLTKAAPATSAAEVLVNSEIGFPTQFTKIEKSLASLGFFTPSSKRLKDQKSEADQFYARGLGQARRGHC